MKQWQRAVDWSKEPDFDLLCAGFPCQSFSLAGKRRGFEDARGTLFFEIVRAVRAKQPRLLFLENVKGLLSHGQGRTFGIILSALDEVGYDLQWKVLNSKNHGVPQNRERVFIIGNLRGTPRPEVFPIGESDCSHPQGNCRAVKKINEESPTMIHNIYGGFKEGIRTFEEYSPTIRSPKGGGDLPMVISHSPRKGNPKLGGTGPLVSSEHSFTLDSSPHIVNDIRRLTPTECERLQGFPDGWTAGVSDTQRYRMMGNAVTVNVIEEIGKRLLEALNGKE